MSSVISRLLPSPRELQLEIPVDPTVEVSIQSSRAAAAAILKGTDPRIALLVGPCSIHESAQALEFAARIADLQTQVESHFLLVMRVFLEKPRTRLGWRGLLYDPYLNGSNDLHEGLVQGRQLLQKIAALSVPIATEFLEPLIAPFLADFVSWGVIGARTAASPPHRQLASGLPFPIGFKNGVHGELDVAISGIIAARTPHSHFTLDPQGRLAASQTTGNPFAHLVLRGSELRPNCDPESIREALRTLREQHLEERLMVDCAHGNSGKDLARQRRVFEETVVQISAGNRAIRGLMLESHLFAGKQPLIDELDQLAYGVSITDPCLGWSETKELVLSAAERLGSLLI